jgi:hypothetical protein
MRRCSLRWLLSRNVRPHSVQTKGRSSECTRKWRLRLLRSAKGLWQRGQS